MREKMFFIVFILLIIAAAESSAQDVSDVWWGSNYMPGNYLIGGCLGYESDYENSLTSFASGFVIRPEAELLLYKPVFSEISPFDFGIAGSMRTGIFFRDYGSYSSDPWFPVGIGVMGTAHMGFKGFNLKFSDYKDSPGTFFGYLSRFDYFIELGIALDIVTEPGSSDHLGIASSTGLSYFINDRFTVTAKYTYWNGLDGFSIGGNMKFGGGQKTREITVNLDPLYYQLYLGRFYSMYWSVFYSGGFYFGGSDCRDGEGSVWELSSKDKSGGVVLVERVLLKSYEDGSKWWKIRYRHDGDETVYEFLVDSRYNLVKLRFRDEHTGSIREYAPLEEDTAEYGFGNMQIITDTDYNEWNTGKEKVRTAAGSFDSDHLVLEDGTSVYEWWVTPDVPGNLVKFSWKTDGDSMSGILTGIIKNGKSELNTGF